MKRAWSHPLLVLIGILCLLPYLPAQQTLRENVEPLAATAHDHSMHEGSHSHDMSLSNEPLDPEKQTKLIADKKESEFNHHLAGFFVVLGGAFILLQTVIGNRWLWPRYVWPCSFLMSGIFVLVWSDTELWPFGSRMW